MIYLDYAATTPPDEEVLGIFAEASSKYFGNSSSLHDIGSAAKYLLDAARTEFSKLLSLDSDGIVFTSGGSESNFLALQTLLASSDQGKNHIIAAKTEHSSITSYLSKLATDGYTISYVDTRSDGSIDIDHLHMLIQPNTALISVAHVNSETGFIQAIEDIASCIQGKGIFLHSDCVQAFGKIDIASVCRFADSFSVSSHKIYGLKGVGAVVFPKIHQLKPALPNISHESGFRSGTVNVPAITAFVSAAGNMHRSMIEELIRITELRKLLIAQLQHLEVPFQLIENENGQLPHIIALTFPGLQGQYIMLELNLSGFAVSTGSACQVGKQQPSKTMLAIGKSIEEAKQLIRISLGKATNEKDIHNLSMALAEIVNR